MIDPMQPYVNRGGRFSPRIAPETHRNIDQTPYFMQRIYLPLEDIVSIYDEGHWLIFYLVKEEITDASVDFKPIRNEDGDYLVLICTREQPAKLPLRI